MPSGAVVRVREGELAKNSEYQRWLRDLRQLAGAASAEMHKGSEQATRLEREGADPLRRVAQVLGAHETARNYVFALARAAEMLPLTDDDPVIVATVAEVKKLVYEPKDRSTSLQLDFSLAPESIGVIAEASRKTLVMELYLLEPKLPEGQDGDEGDPDDGKRLI